MIPVRRTLSIVLTFQCNAACDECGTFSSPKARGVADEARVAVAIRQAHALGFECVVFTGGEATLRWNMLRRLIAVTAGLGLVARLVTNGVWATSQERAVEKLKELKDAGLHEINFSTGDEHQRFVPVTSVIYGIEAAHELQLSHHTMVETRKLNKFTKADLVAATPESLRSIVEARCTESPWMPMSPHAQYEYDDRVIVANKETSPAFLGCESVLGTYVLYPEGTISSCCGLGSRSIRELHVGTYSDDFPGLAGAVEEAEEDALKIALHLYGPVKILEWMAEEDATIVWENRYAHRCQACARIYASKDRKDVIQRVLAKHRADLTFALMLSAGSSAVNASGPPAILM